MTTKATEEQLRRDVDELRELADEYDDYCADAGSIGGVVILSFSEWLEVCKPDSQT